MKLLAVTAGFGGGTLVSVPGSSGASIPRPGGSLTADNDAMRPGIHSYISHCH